MAVLNIQLGELPLQAVLISVSFLDSLKEEHSHRMNVHKTSGTLHWSELPSVLVKGYFNYYWQLSFLPEAAILLRRDLVSRQSWTDFHIFKFQWISQVGNQFSLFQKGCTQPPKQHHLSKLAACCPRLQCGLVPHWSFIVTAILPSAPFRVLGEQAEITGGNLRNKAHSRLPYWPDAGKGG